MILQEAQFVSALEYLLNFSLHEVTGFANKCLEENVMAADVLKYTLEEVEWVDIDGRINEVTLDNITYTILMKAIGEIKQNG